ncbi:MAG: glutamate racemase [Cytophagales bacterium]|nr:glutamate racemase [Armatimonadota bacterium]
MDGPIGVFDSGLGGLTVVREMIAQMPGEAIIYVGDSCHAPYGTHGEAAIRAFSLEITRFLLDRYRCRGIVVACNTATSAAAETLRFQLPVPVVGMEPAVKPAAAVTKTGKVGILATVGTLSSARFAALLTRFEGDGTVEFLMQPCPGLPEAVEEGRADTPETRALVEKYVLPLLAQGADTLVLGCTHYPVLRPLIAAVAGPGVTLIDTGAAVARRAAALFDIRRPGTKTPGRLTLHTTGDRHAFEGGARAILGEMAENREVFPACKLLWRNGELTTDGTN